MNWKGIVRERTLFFRQGWNGFSCSHDDLQSSALSSGSTLTALVVVHTLVWKMAAHCWCVVSSGGIGWCLRVGETQCHALISLQNWSMRFMSGVWLRSASIRPAARRQRCVAYCWRKCWPWSTCWPKGCVLSTGTACDSTWIYTRGSLQVVLNGGIVWGTYSIALKSHDTQVS